MHITLRRYLVVCLAVILSTAAGAFAGYMLARTFVLDHAHGRVNDSSDEAEAELAAAITESRHTLATMNGFRGEFCSPADLGNLRAVVFQSHYLKEAGRVNDGRVACSTTYGPRIVGSMLPQPDVAQDNEVQIYRDLPQFQIAGHSTVAVRQGSSFVVYNPFSSSSLASLHMSYTVTAIDHVAGKSGLLAGDRSRSKGLPLTQRADGILNGEIFATRCSSPLGSCITIHTPVREVLDGSFPVLAVLAALGAFAGGLFSVVCGQIYVRKRSLPAQLHKAIQEDRLSVVYQPIVDLKSGRIVEAEALVRWNDEQGMPVSPDVFVKVAEERGFVGGITRLVVRHVLTDLGLMLRAHPDFRVSVNVAAQDLADAKFLPMLKRALEHARVRPESMGIEITESFTARQQIAKATIARLRACGHYVSIDDFGTGYSSLAYLHDLSVDAIKIDKAFTRAIGTDAVTVSILPQILSMADRLGLHVTVEGIESMDQASYFADAPVSIRAQGWLYGYPMASDLFLHLMEKEPIAPISSTGHAGPVAMAGPAC